ncbi:alpha-amylase family glycosyl hydrolase [Streptomyces sp. NBC_01408]|uniref:alpha-amylase family glycosyl hydrolase n=1 Tax=Streptomyces sp. NBC_01408 TaxID=2903855 RepID=UPI00225A318C|nr:alpha-amylase family glycosyl hydrolase [Streptomyces sp. NBC_01408]MCX4695746.1 alpha-amylase family glycosyl hydrolase [Streptomyces sp. NBC_01408]
MTGHEPTGTPPWWRDAVIYQVYPRSFLDTDGDGVGDLRGVSRRIPYLARLGVDTLWLSPFFSSPMADFGYDVRDHTAVDPLFGDLADFDGLVAAAHAHGLRVLIDYVPNHTSGEHPWFRDARTGPLSPRRDWYVWRDPAPGGGPPNNWITLFGESAWTLDTESGQYYLHSFLSSMPDLNWRNPAVREAMFDVARFWLDRGVDGFRVDCAPLVAKDPALRDNPAASAGTVAHHRPMGGYDSQLHLYDQAHPDLHAMYREFRAVLDAYGDGAAARIALGEIHVYDWKDWSRYFGRQLDEIHLPLSFGLLRTPWEPGAIRDLVREVLGALPAGAASTWVTGSHDDPRVASRVGQDQAANALLLQLTLPGATILYNGDELGLPDAHIAPEDIRDPWGLRTPGLSRDPARSPMPWSDGPGAGFTRAGVRPWLPIVRPPGGDAAAQEDDPGSLLSLTRAVLALRRAHPALGSGAIEFADALDGVLAYTRTGSPGGESLLVTLNLTDGPVRIDSIGGIGRTAAGRSWERLLTTAPEARAAAGPRGVDPHVLAPHEGVIWRTA